MSGRECNSISIFTSKCWRKDLKYVLFCVTISIIIPDMEVERMELLDFITQMLGVVTGSVIFSLFYKNINNLRNAHKPHESKTEENKG